MGVASVDFGFAGATVDQMLEEMKRFAGQVMAKL